MPKAHKSGSATTTMPSTNSTTGSTTGSSTSPQRSEPNHRGRGADDAGRDDHGRDGTAGRTEGTHDDKGAAATVGFTFSSDNQSVTAMTVAGPKGSRTLDLTDSTFKTTVGTNDKGATAVTQVVQTRTETGEVETHRYSDKDGDGVYTETFELQVLTATPTAVSGTRPADDHGHRGDRGHGAQHQFTFNADGTIASDTLVLSDGQTRADAIETGEKYLRTTIDGRTYVVKTVAKGTEYHFEFFRDDNGDGKWTEVAEGHGDASAVDAATQMVSLVGLTPLLQAANAVVG